MGHMQQAPAKDQHAADARHILWLGAVLDEPSMLHRRAVSPAANRWQGNLIRALQEVGVGVVTVGHIPEPAWPRGQAFPGNRGDRLAEGLAGHFVGYLNLPGVREKVLSGQYLRTFKGVLRRVGRPLAVVTYNAYDYNQAVGFYAQERLGIPWVCIIADAPGAGPAKDAHDRAVGAASGRIYLGWGSYASCGQLPKLHLDGGVADLCLAEGRTSGDGHADEAIVLYTGAMNSFGGVGLLARAFRQVKHPRARLWICGPGTSAEVMQLAADDPRIRVFGLVPEAELQTLSRQASVFVNPRPSSIPDNRMNFPSKVLEYLRYGKPVLSTWTEGLSPAYQSVLVVVEQETPEALANRIDEVLTWSSEQRLALEVKIRSFLLTQKLWSQQARRLIRWLYDEVLRSDEDFER